MDCGAIMNARMSVVSGFLGFVLCTFPSQLPAQRITVTLLDFDSSKAPAAGTYIELIPAHRPASSGANPTTFFPVLPYYSYRVSCYYQKSFWGYEFWGNQYASTGYNDVSLTVRRYSPYASVVLKMDSTGAPLSSGQPVPSGSQLRAEVTIHNPSSFVWDCRPHLAIDRSRSGTYDFELNWPTQTVASASSRVFSATFTPAESGTNRSYYAYEVVAADYGGDILTDAADWQQTFKTYPFVEPPRLSSPQLTGTTFQVSASTVAGSNYVLEYKTALTDPNWTPLQTNGGNGGQVTFTNTGATNSSRFYRLYGQ